MVYDALVDLVGSVPDGLEEVVYIFSIVITIWLLLCVLTFIGGLFKRFTDY